MTERIKFVPVLKLTWEYFKEQPIKMLLGVLFTGLLYFYFTAQFSMLYFPDEFGIKDIAKYSAYGFSLLLGIHLIMNFKRKNYLFLACIGTIFVGYEAFIYWYKELALPLFYVSPFSKFIPMSLLFVFVIRLIFQAIDQEPFSLAKETRYTHSIPAMMIVILMRDWLYFMPSFILHFFMGLMTTNPDAFRLISKINSYFFIVLTFYLLARFFCSPFLLLEYNHSLIKSLKLSWKITRKNTFVFMSPFILFYVIRIAIHLCFLRLLVRPYFDHLYYHFRLLEIFIQGLYLFPCYLFITLIYRLMSNQYFTSRDNYKQEIQND